MRHHQHTIAIIGGGVSGSLTALNLVRRGMPSRIVVLDPASQLGLGLAYSTASMEHLLNVPAGKIGIFPDQPDHFLDWLQLHYPRSFVADDYVPRAVFGQYVQSVLDSTHGIEHIRSTVLDCIPTGAQFMLQLADANHLIADIVVLATGNYASAMLPEISKAVENSGAYYHSPWEPSTYEGLAPDAPVTLIGSGLTAVDVVLRLRELGHRGTIKMMSRNGALPRRHAPYQPLSQSIIPSEPPRSARVLLQTVHRAIEGGLPWRAVIDSLRDQTNDLWLALPLVEQRRFRRHLQRRWDVVRHRMAPSVGSRIEKELSEGSLEVIAGKLLAVEPCAGGASVTVRTKQNTTRTWTASRVLNCTGPNMDYSRVGSPLMNNLFARGLITAGPLRFGLWSNEWGALRAQNGTFSTRLFNIGPGRQGMLLESIAVPELSTQAVELAETLSAQLSQATMMSDIA